MRIKDARAAKVVRILPDNGAGQAAKIMLGNHVSRIPVVDGGHLLGVTSQGRLDP